MNDNYELHLPYLSSCRLIMKNQTLGFHDNWKLYILKDQKQNEVKKIGDLFGCVRIKKPEHALSFVRIRSNPIRILSLNDEIDPFIEVLNKEKISYDPVFGDKADYLKITSFNSQENKYFGSKYEDYPKIKKVNKGFQISRLIISVKYDICELTETVSEFGKMENLHFKQIRNYENGLSILLSFPMRM